MMVCGQTMFSTLLNYSKDMKRIEPLFYIKIRKLTSNDVQSWIAELSARGLAPKTIKNTYGLLRSSLTFSGLDNSFVIHLPKSKKEKKIAPESEQIIRLYESAPRKMKIAIALASHHSLRRGEISAIKYGDISGHTLYVHADVVRGKDGWIYKEIPKTDTSNRNIYLSDEELELIGTGDPNQNVVPLTPSSIGTNFYNIRKRVGLEHIRFHDLRVYFASICVAMGLAPLERLVGGIGELALPVQLVHVMDLALDANLLHGLDEGLHVVVGIAFVLAADAGDVAQGDVDVLLVLLGEELVPLPEGIERINEIDQPDFLS